MKEKLAESDIETMTKTVDAALAWIDENQSAEKDEYDAKRKEVHSLFY